MSNKLPMPCTMYEWEAHGLLEARKVMEQATGAFSIIGVVVDHSNKSMSAMKSGLVPSKILRPSYRRPLMMPYFILLNCARKFSQSSFSKVLSQKLLNENQGCVPNRRLLN